MGTNFIKAIKHCRKHLRFFFPRLIPSCPFNSEIVDRLVPIEQRVSFNRY